MAQKTKKSPTPSTAKKIGARLPKGSPKGSRSSVPPDAVKRLAGPEVPRVFPSGIAPAVSPEAPAEHSAVPGGAR